MYIYLYLLTLTIDDSMNMIIHRAWHKIIEESYDNGVEYKHRGKWNWNLQRNALLKYTFKAEYKYVPCPATEDCWLIL